MLLTMTRNRIFNNIILILTIPSFAFAQVGQRCIVEHTGNTGICKASSDCPRAEEEAKNGISPTLCGRIQFNIPIVCCDNSYYNSNFPQPNENSFLNDTDTDPNPDGILYPEDNPPPQQESYPNRSEQKCQEYNKIVTGVIQVIPLVTHTEATNISIAKCSNNGVALIVGGKPANPGEFPFMAAIGFRVGNEIEYRCGGTLVSEYYIVTAAHCTFSRDDGEPKVVRLGDIDISKRERHIDNDYDIKQFAVHPDYNYPQKYNDIALIRTATRVRFSKFVRPACLYTESRVDQSYALATGWGKTDFAASEISTKLQKVSLEIYQNSRCAQVYQRGKHLPDGIRGTMLCAGEVRGGKDTCQGDSGGPLIITKKGNQCKFYIIGVTSFGKSCGQPNTPAVYTRVSEYIPWLESIIW